MSENVEFVIQEHFDLSETCAVCFVRLRRLHTGLETQMQRRLFSVGLTVLGQSSPSSSAGGMDMCTVLVGVASKQPVLPVLRVSPAQIQ